MRSTGCCDTHEEERKFDLHPGLDGDDHVWCESNQLVVRYGSKLVREWRFLPLHVVHGSRVCKEPLSIRNVMGLKT